MDFFRSARGQSTVEYIGAVLLIAGLMAAILAFTPPGRALAELVEKKIEYALCVVGNDVCSNEDALAKGLEPCKLSAEDRRRGVEGTIAIVDLGDSRRLIIEERSDGTFLVTSTEDEKVGVSVGTPSLKIKNFVNLGASASAGLAYGNGTTVEVDGREGLRRLLGDAEDDPQAARELVQNLAERRGKGVTRYKELKGSAGAKASASVGRDLKPGSGRKPDYVGATAAAATGAEVGMSTAIGMSTRDGVRTFYYNVPASASSGGALRNILPSAGKGAAASWQDSEPPVLTMETTSERDGLENQVKARIVLSNPKDREVAKRFLLTGGLSGQRAMAAQMKRRGVVQRFTYEVKKKDEGTVGGKIGLGARVGIGRVADVSRRRLVDAKVLSQPIGGRREDCLNPKFRS